MFTPIRTIVLPLAFVSLLTVPGCGSGKVKGVSHRSLSWSIAAKDPTPGIHKGAVQVMTIRFGPPSGVTVVLWSDGSGGNHRSDTREDQASFEGDVLTADGRRIPYRWVTDDGINAKVTIDGTVYDSAEGSLFLISTQSQKPQVRQLSAEVGNFPNEPDAIKEYAQGSPEIATFFKEARKNTPVEQGK